MSHATVSALPTPPFGLTLAFEAALSYAARRHRNQYRKVSGTPYIGHVLSVAGLVLQYGGREEVAIAALLHDVLEDAEPTDVNEVRCEIGRNFGPSVLRLVESCSDAPAEHRHETPWQVRKERHLMFLEHCTCPDILLISIADKLDNARSLYQNLCRFGDSVWQHFSGGRAGTLWYYSSLASVLSRRSPQCLSHDFAGVVASILQTAEIRG